MTVRPTRPAERWKRTKMKGDERCALFCLFEEVGLKVSAAPISNLMRGLKITCHIPRITPTLVSFM